MGKNLKCRTAEVEYVAWTRGWTVGPRRLEGASVGESQGGGRLPAAARCLRGAGRAAASRRAACTEPRTSACTEPRTSWHEERPAVDVEWNQGGGVPRALGRSQPVSPVRRWSAGWRRGEGKESYDWCWAFSCGLNITWGTRDQWANY